MSEHMGTTCVQGGYRPGDAEPRQIPIYQSTTWKYDTSEHMGKLFDLEESGYFYTRLQNPTNDYVAAKICEMESGTAAMLTKFLIKQARLTSFMVKSRFMSVIVIVMKLIMITEKFLQKTA